MYWMSKPPYGRWALAVLIVVVAGYMDLSGPAVEAYPFAAEEVAAGEMPEVEWRHVPAGVLPASGDLSGHAVGPIPAGTPLMSSLLESAPLAPEDWWSVSVELPLGTALGSDALLSLPDQIVTGVVVGIGDDNAFGGSTSGLVAVAPEHAASIAAGAANGSVVVLVRP